MNQCHIAPAALGRDAASESKQTSGELLISPDEALLSVVPLGKPRPNKRGKFRRISKRLSVLVDSGFLYNPLLYSSFSPIPKNSHKCCQIYPLLRAADEAERCSKEVGHFLREWLWSPEKHQGWLLDHILLLASFNCPIFNSSFTDFLKLKITQQAPSERAAWDSMLTGWWLEQDWSQCRSWDPTWDAVAGTLTDAQPA